MKIKYIGSYQFVRVASLPVAEGMVFWRNVPTEVTPEQGEALLKLPEFVLATEDKAPSAPPTKKPTHVKGT